MYPEADVPVVQLSLDRNEPALFHYELGARLSPLRDEGILILGSGNVIHNLHAYSWGRKETSPLDWAVQFETDAKRLLARHNHEPLIAYESMGPAARLSAPTPDHYLPFLLRHLALSRRRKPQLPGRRIRRRINLDAVRPHWLGTLHSREKEEKSEHSRRTHGVDANARRRLERPRP
jgi:aromatic ring-opening dioxygenase catalytic subunit (LigB family)